MPPRVSVFTPSHKPTFLDDCYASLAAQTLDDWEWTVVLNGGNRWRPPVDDPRVQVLVRDDLPPLVGAVKRAAVEACSADLLVELDHDDMLTIDCLAALVTAFEDHPEAALIYSDAAQVLTDGTYDPSRFDAQHGWLYDDVQVVVKGEEMTVLRCRSLAPTPHNVGLIWYAPNHVRAFARWAYDKAGGYDAALHVLDDQDLMARLYAHGPFVHLPHVLYLQRTHSGNTQSSAETNAAIQTETVWRYEQTVSDLALAWSKRKGLSALDLGAAHGAQDGYLGVDLEDGPGVHLVGDVFDVLDKIKDSSVGVIRAVDFLEHLRPEDKVRILNECWRVLAPGGLWLTITPSTDGRGAWQDPTHLSGWNEHSWWYVIDEAFAGYVPAIKARFQATVLRTGFPSPWHEQHNISYVTAYLVADKPGGSRQGGFRLGR